MVYFSCECMCAFVRACVRACLCACVTFVWLHVLYYASSCILACMECVVLPAVKTCTIESTQWESQGLALKGSQDSDNNKCTTNTQDQIKLNVLTNTQCTLTCQTNYYRDVSNNREPAKVLCTNSVTSDNPPSNDQTSSIGTVSFEKCTRTSHNEGSHNGGSVVSRVRTCMHACIFDRMCVLV